MQPFVGFAKARAVVAKRGLPGTARRVLFMLRRRMFPKWEPLHPFDREHGVATSGLLSQLDLQSGHAHDPHTTAYHGTQPSTFRGGIEHWRAALGNHSEGLQNYTFIDVGCGKGRVLMLASELPFQRIVGLELNAEVADIARENLRRWNVQRHPCEQVEVLTRDVLEFPIPPEPTLIYMYNPFEGDLFKCWVQTLAFTIRERTAPLYLLYVYPRYEEMMKLLPGARLLWSGDVPLDSSEMAVDLFGCVMERVSLYQLAPSM